MKKTALIIAIAGLCSCVREADVELPPADGAEYRISASLEPGTKGNIADDTVIDNFCWIILKDDIVLFSGTGSMSGIRLTTNTTYNVLAWANNAVLSIADALSIISDDGLNGIMDQVYRFSSQRSEWNGLKIPASFCATNLTPDELDDIDGRADDIIRLPLRRLTAKINLNVQYDEMLRTMFPEESFAGQSYGISVNSVKLGGLSQDVGLFRPECNRRHASSGTVDQSDGTLTYSFYVPESLGGDILASNTSPSGKNYTALQAAGADPNAYPFIEADINFSAYLVSSPFTKTYRFYLGGNSTTNFDVLRNHEYDITLLLGYNGLDVCNTWKLDGETSGLDGRSCYIQSCNKTHAAAGEKIVLSACYEYDGGGNSAAEFYLKQNGFALCTGADKNAYLNSGTIPDGFTQLDEDTYIMECKECHHYYSGMPAVTGDARNTWLEENLACSSTEVNCMWCGTPLFTRGGGGDWDLFNGFAGTFTGTNVNCLSQFASDFEYTVPATSQVGDVIRLYAVTRDGRAGGHIDITVSNEDGYPRFDTPLGDEMYVAQKTILSASRWARGIYGDSPSFSFSITSDSRVAGISAIDGKSVSISAKKPGTFTVACTCNGKNAGSFVGTVSAPSIGYPGTQTSHSLTVTNNGATTSFTNPVYIVQDGGDWVEYTTYDNDLYASCLGTPVGCLAENNGWVGWSNGTPSVVYLEHAYKNGIVDPANVVPFRSASTRLDIIRFTSPLLAGPRCDIQVYFDISYSGLGLIKDYGSYYKYIADSSLIPSQESLQFNVYQHGIFSFPDSEFFGENNGEQVPLTQVIISKGSGNYIFNTAIIGHKRLYWRLKGTGNDSFQLDICRISVKQKYIGSVTTTCDADDTETRKDLFAGFVSWQDTPVGAYNTYETFEVPSGTLQGFRVYVGCKNIVKDLFRIRRSAFLPTEGLYDPNPSTGNNHNWNFYHSESDAVFYTQAKHFYDDDNLSYTAAIARWASYSYLGMFLRTIETHGFGMEQYKSFNTPLFVPASSPQTISGVTWSLTSDSGGKAVWESADGLHICEFTYNSW